MRRAAGGGFPKAGGRHHGGMRAPTCHHVVQLYAFPRLRVLSIEVAGAGPTMEPRPTE
jgi:hypothetical protein